MTEIRYFIKQTINLINNNLQEIKVNNTTTKITKFRK